MGDNNYKYKSFNEVAGEVLNSLSKLIGVNTFLITNVTIDQLTIQKNH